MHTMASGAPPSKRRRTSPTRASVGPSSPLSGPVIRLVADKKVPFPAYYVRARTKTSLREYVAFHAQHWMELLRKRRRKSAIMFDIDDTILDGHERVINGFDVMRELFDEFSMYFPVHIVTARPDTEHGNVMRMLRSKGFCIPPDRLHMLPEKWYGADFKYVERFKWDAYDAIARQHGGVIARFGDKMWDVAHLDALHTSLAHVHDRDCYMFLDPKMKGTVSFKLPGMD